MAVASQKMIDTRFLLLIRGALMEAPTRVEPERRKEGEAPRRGGDREEGGRDRAREIGKSSHCTVWETRANF